jgi:FtsH-binding integral membrane protein
MGVSYAAQTVVRSAEERLALIRRTYSVVLAGVFVTMLGVAVAFTQPAIMSTVAAHPFITFFLSFVPLLMAQRNARTFPANIGFTFLYTFLVGLWIAPVLAFAERAQPGIIGETAVLTGAAFGTLTGYAFLSRRNFSAWGSFFFVGLIVLIVTIFLNAFFLHSAGAATWIGGAAVLIFSGLLVFDTWRLRNVYGPDDYIPAAINIYLDILNMFLWILQLLGGGNRR